MAWVGPGRRSRSGLAVARRPGGRALVLAALLLLALTPSSASAQPAPNTSSPSLALVLSGGGARGLAHVGVLRAFEEAGLAPDFVVGSSMGAVIGAFYACGYSADRIDSLVLSLDWNELFSEASVRRYQPVLLSREERPGLFNLFWSGDSGIEVGESLAGAVGPQEIYSRFTMAAEAASGGNFDSLAVPYRAAATDLRTGRLFILDHGSLPQIMLASSAVPLVFQPVLIDTMVLVDGGVLDNIPTAPARDRGARVTVAVDVSTPFKSETVTLAPLALLWRTFEVMSQLANPQGKADADLVITPDLGDIATHDFERADSLIAEGYRAGQAAVPRIRELLAAAGVPPRRMPDVAARRAAFRKRSVGLLEHRTVGRIRVEGLRNYESSLVRRDMSLREGRPFDPRLALRSLAQVEASDRFRSVVLALRPVDTDTLDVVVHVVERPSWSAGVGFRADSERGWGGVLRLRNHNIWRTGSAATFETVADERAQSFLLRTETPFLLPLGLAQRTQVLYRNEVIPRYRDGRRIGSVHLRHVSVELLHLGIPLGRYALLEAGPQWERFEDEGFAAQGLREASEDYVSVAARLTFLRVAIGRGGRGTIDLGSEAEAAWQTEGGEGAYKWFQAHAEGRLPLPASVTAGMRARSGLSVGDPPVSQWFRLGGPGSLAGLHPEERLAPQVVAGGVTLTRPIRGLLQLQLEGDAGWGWNDRREIHLRDVRGGFGAGFRVELPLGPLEVMYGHTAGGHDLWTATVGYPLRPVR